MKVIIYPDVDIWNFVLQGLAHRTDVLLFPLNRHCTRFQQAIRKYVHVSNLPISWIIGSSLRSQLQHLRATDSLVVCDYTALNLLVTIKRQTQQLQYHHLWLWNNVEAEGYTNQYLQSIIKRGFKISTFSSDDASRYNLIFRSQFFCIRWAGSKFTLTDLPERDFLFVGQEKNRREEIDQIEQALSVYKCLFKVVRKSSDFITYQDYCRLATQSRCIIEIVPHDKPFCTLRPFEAIALGRKLLTNNVEIRKKSFYHPHNIFVFGEDDLSSLPEFLFSPICVHPQEIVDKHDINSWIDSFE